MVQVYFAAEPVIPQSEFSADIELGRLLPFQVAARQLIGNITRKGRIVRHFIQPQKTVFPYLRVTGQPIAGPQFKIAQQRGIA